MAQYDYTKEPVSLDRLTQEVQQSGIVTALDHMDLLGSALSIFFKADLSDADKSTLDALVAAHDGTPLPQNVPQPVTVENTANVSTRFERVDIDLKMACAEADVQSDGTAEISIKVPGTIGSGDGRLIGGGELFFDVADVGDRAIQVAVVDVDNILGMGAETVIKSYCDTDLPDDNRGWYVPVKRGHLDVESMGFYGMIPSGLYLEVCLKKGNGVTTGKAYINIFWGKVE
jgi:hypothetical protein